MQKTFQMGLAAILFALAPCPAEAEDRPVLFVSPAGKEGASGTRENPLPSVEEALKLLPGGEGTIRLLGGVYRETARVSGKGIGPLLIEAERDVRFEGGADLSALQSWPEQPDLLAGTVSGISAICDPAGRLRYLHQIDEAGVRAWPGSFAYLDDERLLVHPAKGATAQQLIGNRLETGIEISRDNTTLRGAQFSNFLGTSRAAAVRVRNATGVKIEDCRIENSAHGIAIEKDARDTRVSGCVIADVSTGIRFGGIGLEVERCVFLGATGDYAFRDEAEYDWSNGIRFYHPAEQAVIRHCLTAGFWAGLYHKTTPGLDGAKPFLCEGNVFLDSIKTGTARQTTSVYRNNVVAGGATLLRRLSALGAKVEENYFFAWAKTRNQEHDGGNHLGGNPFQDAAAGNLEIVEALPEAVLTAAREATAGKFPWPEEFADLYREKTAVEAQRVEPLVVASSERGAVITAKLAVASGGVLKYRLSGSDEEWRSVAGREAKLSTEENLTKIEWPEDAPDAEGASSAAHALSFVLTAGELEPERDYEAMVEIGNASRQPERIQFSTRGGPRTIPVGASREIRTLQDALDRALPGDTVQLEAGVWTEPAVLTHGGGEDFPIVIQGAGERETILDGGKKCVTVLELKDAPHVVIRSLQVRHFTRAGILAQNSPFLTVEYSRFLNKRPGKVMTQGTGILLKDSPQSAIRFNVFTRLLYGVQAIDSPRLSLLNNTAFNNIFSSALLKNSARDSKVMYNSFTFTGNISLYLIEADSAAFKSLVCDFNNYGTSIRTIGATAARAYAEAGVKPGEAEPSFPVPERYGTLSGSKRIIDYITGDGQRMRFFNMQDWRKFSSKDAHTLYADPGYAEPLKGDFRLLPESANILREQSVIGAAPVKGASHEKALQAL